MKIENLFYWIERNRTQVKLFLVPTLVLMIAGVYAFVYVTGGSKYVFSHSMYLPILLAAIIFGAKGGVLVALAGGLVLGPFMPIDTLTGERQDTINWLYRIGFFTLVGFLVGAARDIVFIYLNRFRWNSTHDSMSGLPNMFALEMIISGLTDSDEDESKTSYLLVARLENHVQIEASFGVMCVNGIIVQMADIIRNELPHSVEICQIGIERLGFVQSAKDEHAIITLTNKLGQILTKPFGFDDIQIHANIYLGMITLDHSVKVPKLSIQRASYAASEACNSRRRHAILTSIDDSIKDTENLQLLGELEDALGSGQVFMHYQPKVESTTGKIDSVEALMRWQHPVRGNIPPGKFIPYAENSTLIDQITHFAIDKSLAQLVAWEKNGLNNIRMAVNISTKNLLNPDFYKTVLQLLDLHGVNGERLELEITESSFMEDMESSIVELIKLTKAGIILSIDDFGTGYSSLQYLAKMPVSIIKIDQGFIRLLPTESDSAKIVRAAIGLAHSLGMKVVAEGVENRAAYDFLMHAGCDLIQGYFVGRPVMASELEKICKASKGLMVHV